ncbi:DUF2934 domain-containing protein [Rhizobium phaseoli]|uniref:DUF2934 domain-containing protein n=1 Tax=Rhizobium phaseoli TaxID=396 RepID=UPI001F448E2D|nr:DUF2934 domain-containing protein [Rhizobium phaseoli]MDK4725454.1 DUF2934 domain-containing protein [Rhizobium phaseoli]
MWEDEGVQSGRHEEHWLQAEREILHEFDQLDGNDVPNLEALREAAREHTDAFIVATDLIDARRRRGFASSPDHVEYGSQMSLQIWTSRLD